LRRIFLLDDHAWFRRALATLLERDADLKLVAQAGSLAEARDATSERWGEIDVAIVDLMLPDGMGTDLIREMREANPGLPVLALTIVQDPEVLRLARAVGADAVVSKAAPFEEILDTIRRVAERE
jgi:two-component system, NarL family, response regulator DevR